MRIAARELARRGVKTLLVDSKSFPRDKVCGGYVNGRAMAVLHSVGLGALCEDIGGKVLSEVEIRSGSQKLHVPLPKGVGVTRRRLDSALVDKAIDAGVEFLPEARATVTLDNDSCSRRVALQKDGQVTTVFRAKVVLACDGLNHSSLREWRVFRSRVAPRARIGVGGVIEDASVCYRGGRIYMTIGPRGYVGITRVEEGQVCLAAALDVDYVRQCGMRDAVLHLLEDAKTPIAPALRRMLYRGTPPLTRRTPVLAAQRVFLLGDAAGYVEPFTGEGMAMAWTAAKRVVPLAERAVANWHPDLAKEWSHHYRHAVGKRLTICRTLASLIRHPWAVRTALGVLNTFPHLCAPIVGQMNRAPLDLKACNL